MPEAPQQEVGREGYEVGKEKAVVRLKVVNEETTVLTSLQDTSLVRALLLHSQDRHDENVHHRATHVQCALCVHVCMCLNLILVYSFFRSFI